MRQIALDTETTGLYPDKGDRIIEIGAVEIQNRRVTEHTFHCYLNPERDVPAESVRIHGLTTERLKNEPLFATVVDDFLEFINGAELIIHNAAFDVSFLNMELARANKPSLENVAEKITDSIALAKKTLPGKGYSLDHLCDYFKINRKNRTMHGALIDSELLAKVYLALTRGQESFSFETLSATKTLPQQAQMPDEMAAEAFQKTKIILANSDEIQAHEAILNAIAKKTENACLWQNL